MTRQRYLDRTIALTTMLVVLVLVGGSWRLLEDRWQTAYHDMETTLQNADRIVESVVNREFLQVDGALTSLPVLLATTVKDGINVDPQYAGRVLRGLNFQTFAFRDITMLRPDGDVWAFAHPNSWN
jgi:hypothetical protein